MNKHSTELLEKHFDTAFLAPSGIKKLRELILALAMQGRLVPQDPSEQSADELLKEITAEKQRLEKEGKIKKPKSLPPVTEEEKPYSLPQGWEWVRFGEIAQHNSGKTLDGGRNTGLLRKYITTSNVHWGKFQLSNLREMLIREDELDRCSARKGDLLICEGGEAGRAAVWELPEEICFQNHVHRARLYRDVNPYFAYRFFEKINASGEINNYRKGVGISNMSSKALASIAFPLPPNSEQRRIIAKIDELMARCDELEKLRTAQQGARLNVHATAIKQLLNIAEPDQHQFAQTFLAEHFGELYAVKENVAELRKAILQLAVRGKLAKRSKDDGTVSELLERVKSERLRLGGLGATSKRIESNNLDYSVPGHWSILPLGEILIFGPTNGYSPKAVDYETNVKSLTLSATTSGIFKGEHSKFIAEEIPADSELWLQDGDILVQRGNSLQYVGVPAIYRGERHKYIYPDLMMKLRVSAEINGKYIFFVMSAAASRNYLRDRASGTSGTMPKINQKTLNGLPIPMPPLEEQHRIVRIIDQMMELCDSLEQKIDADTGKQAELLSALIRAQSQSNTAEEPRRASPSKAQVVDLATYRASIGCYAINKLASAQYFGRTAAAKVMYMAQAHVGLDMSLKPQREAAGPLDTWIYDFERQAQGKRWFEVNEKTLASGKKKVEYRCLSALSEPAAKAEALMAPDQKSEFDRLIYALADKRTEEVEIIATLFAVWNDFLIDGVQPMDAQIISDVRENWHERKARFTAAELGHWLDWLRSEKIVPRGLPPRTVQQSKLGLD